MAAASGGGSRQGRNPARLKGVYTRDSVFDRLGEIKVPTLVLTGAEDVATVPEKGQRIAGAIPGARFELIPAAGHSAPLENPDAITRAIADFIAQT